MDRLAPLTGPLAVGPLGIRHLPRMWQKGILKTAGLLPDEYHFVTRGFDIALCEGIGIDPPAFAAFAATLPGYLATEAWVRANATNLANAAATNEKLLVIGPPAERLPETRARAGITAEWSDGARLVNLDDFMWLHEFVTAHRGGFDETIVPAVTSLMVGELGILHLARLWAKAMIKTLGALPEGYHSGSGPLDEQLAEAIGMDLAASVRYTEAELPTFPAYEHWVRAKATKLDPDTIEAWNERMRTREKRVEMAAAERAIVGITDENERRGVLLNDLLDWHILHEKVVAHTKP